MTRARDMADAGSKANFLDNVSADINTTYAPKASPTFTGTSTFADLKATAIKHTNGTTAITINSDGSLSGNFEGAMKFVGLGKVAINTSGTEGTDYPAAGKTWIVNVLAGWHYAGSFMSGSFGQPTLFLSRNQNGDWLQNDGSFSSTTSTSWISRQTSPDGASLSYDDSISDNFSAILGAEGLSSNTDGTEPYNFAMPTHTYEISTLV